MSDDDDKRPVRRGKDGKPTKVDVYVDGVKIKPGDCAKTKALDTMTRKQLDELIARKRKEKAAQG